MSKDLEYKLKLDKEHFKKGMEQSIDQAKELKNTLLELLGIGAGLEFMKGAAEAFVTAEKSADNLAQSLKANGGTIESLEKLKQLNEELENKGIFSHVQSEQAEAFALQAGLTTEQIKKMIPIAEDWAARTGKSVEEATRHIIKGTFGADKELKLLGVSMDKHLTRAQNFSNELKSLGTKFGGANEEIATTTEAGKLVQLKHSYETFLEEVGNDLFKIFDKIRPFLMDTIKNFKELLHWIEGNKNMIMKVGEAILIGIGIWKLYTAGVWLATEASEALVAVNPFAIILVAATALLAVVGAISGQYDDVIRKQNEYYLKQQLTGEERMFNTFVDDEKEKYKIKGDLNAQQLDESFSGYKSDLDRKAKQALFVQSELKNKLSDLELQVNPEYLKASKQAEDYIAAQKRYEKFRSSYLSTKPVDTEKNHLDTIAGKETARENITINIAKFIETFELHAASLPEAAPEIRRQVLLYFQEAFASVKYLGHQ